MSDNTADRYGLENILGQINHADEKGYQYLVIRPLGDSEEFVRAIHDNRIECELRDRGYIANLIQEERKPPYLYISW